MTAAPVPMRLAWLLVAAAILPGCGGGRLVAPAPPAPDIGSPPAAHAPIWKPIGVSVEGRPLLAAQSGSGPVRIYLIGGIHGDEIEGRSALDFAKDVTHAAATIRIVRDLNPDGTAAYRRTNARGLDLNRNWPARNFAPGSGGGPTPLSEPETRALDQDLRAFRPHVVVVLHSSAIGPLGYYDRPAENLPLALPGVRQRVRFREHGRLDRKAGVVGDRRQRQLERRSPLGREGKLPSTLARNPELTQNVSKPRVTTSDPSATPRPIAGLSAALDGDRALRFYRRTLRLWAHRSVDRSL